MKSQNCSRRNALKRLVKMAALAAGLGAAETKRLLAQIGRDTTPDMTALIGVNALDKNVKALKIMLMPKSRQAEVFKNEFGRLPLGSALARRLGGFGCKSYLGTGGSCGLLDCGIHICNGETCPQYGNYGPEETLDIFSQTCPSQCNHCPAKDKPCWFNKKHINLGEVKSNWLREVQADPFIRALYKAFNQTTPEALETQLLALLTKRRQGL